MAAEGFSERVIGEGESYCAKAVPECSRASIFITVASAADTLLVARLSGER
jgi:hypothetical protein